MNPSDQARQVGVVDSWLAQSLFFTTGNDPGDGAVLLDTGPLTAGYYDLRAGLAVSAALGVYNIVLLWRNAANNDTLWAEVIITSGADYRTIELKNFKLNQNERFRWFVLNAWIGWFSASIIIIRRA